MSAIRKILLLAAAVGIGSASFAADCLLIWTDTSTPPGVALNTRVYEQSSAGIALPNLPDRWKQIAAPSCTPDTDPARPGRQNSYLVPNLAPGVHVYAVVATNAGGDSAPSNAKTFTVTVPPPSPHTDLIVILSAP